jgi:hypothetical protein
MPALYPPLGTIIASALSFDQLTFVLGETQLADNQKSYAPCDGRTIQGSRLSQFTTPTSMLNSPDLRGKFLRGLNSIYATNEPPFGNWQTVGDPDGQGRVVTDFQADSVASHQHTYVHFQDNGIHDMSNDQDQRNCSYGPTYPDNTSAYGGSETRPRNVSVYYYIKINP